MEGHHQTLLNRQDERRIEGRRLDVQETKQQAQLINPGAASPASASSSPSHDFSFTIPLHPSARTTAETPDTSKPPPDPLAIDLSPADKIFFHGHLLPLHLLSHLPVSPRSSINSLDSFTLPIDELSEDNKDNSYNSTSTTSSDDHYINMDHPTCQEGSLLQGKGRGKSKTFSLFGLSRWRKACIAREKDPQEEKQKRKSKFDVRHAVKRYLRLFRPFFSFRNRRGNSPIHQQQPYSFSGNLQVMRNKEEMRGRRGEFSAPASMRTSPPNSGLLVASGTVTPTKSDSTVEELQAAIQAAIAHCKNSIASEDNVKLP